MKSFYLCLFILTFLISCDNNEQGFIVRENDYGLRATPNDITGRGTVYPANDSNVYDIAGQLHFDISESYVVAGDTLGSDQQCITRVESIANNNSEFVLIQDASYTSVEASRINLLLNGEPGTMDTILSASVMTVPAQQSIKTFISTLMLYQSQEKDYEEFYHYIISYETAILADESLDQTDKRYILTCSSIARYGFYFARKQKQKPRDRDWDISIGCLIAGVDGTSQSTSKAVTMSVVAGIINNN